MKVVKAFGPQDLRVVEQPIPKPAEGWVLLRMTASGICGSDKWYWYVTAPTENIAGHEVAGEVVEVGKGVHQLKVGDRVAVNNVVGCGKCAACRAGRFVYCANLPDKDVNHGFSEYLVAPEVNCLLLDERTSNLRGSLIFDNWGTPYAAIRKAGIRAGDEVVVSGCGPIGLAAVGLCKMLGAAVTALDPLPYRQQAALRMGAVSALAPGENAAAELRELMHGDGPDAFIECSGNGAAYPLGMAALRIGGILVSIGEHASFVFEPSETIIRKHLRMQGSWYTTIREGAEVQQLMLQGLIQPEAIVTHQVTLDQLPTFFGEVCDFKSSVLKAVVVAG